MALDIHIITHDTAQALGLKHILYQYFNLSAQICKPNNLSHSNENTSVLYITSHQCFAENSDFFFPRRNRTILISQTATDDRYSSINVNCDESEIINQLSAIIESLDNSVENSSTELSPREIEVLKLIAIGLINKEIADKLDISLNTVLSHRKNISSKLGIKSVSGLGIYAIMNGYISENDLMR